MLTWVFYLQILCLLGTTFGLETSLCYVNIEPHVHTQHVYPTLLLCWLGFSIYISYVNLEPHWVLKQPLLCSYVDLGFLSTNPMFVWNHNWSWNIFMLCQHRTTCTYSTCVSYSALMLTWVFYLHIVCSLGTTLDLMLTWAFYQQILC